VAILTVIATVWATHQAGAFTLIERDWNFANVAIVKGQTVRINVANLGDEPVTFNFSIFDSKGIDHLPRAEATVEPGQSAYVDLNADLIPLLEGRQQIRAAARATMRNEKAGIRVITSCELYSNDTGKTELVLEPTYLPAVQ
jgi:hypothetical protein